MRHKQCYLFIFSASSDNKRFVSRKRLIISLSVFLLFWRWIKIKGTNTKKKRIKEIGSDIFYPLVLNVAPNETVEKPKLEIFYSASLFIYQYRAQTCFACFFSLIRQFQRFALTGAGAVVDSAWEQKKNPKQEKCLTRSVRHARHLRRTACAVQVSAVLSVQCPLCWVTLLPTKMLIVTEYY